MSDYKKTLWPFAGKDSKKFREQLVSHWLKQNKKVRYSVGIFNQALLLIKMYKNKINMCMPWNHLFISCWTQFFKHPASGRKCFLKNFVCFIWCPAVGLVLQLLWLSWKQWVFKSNWQVVFVNYHCCYRENIKKEDTSRWGVSRRSVGPSGAVMCWRGYKQQRKREGARK